MTLQIVVVVLGLLSAAVLVAVAVRNARRAPQPGEWHGDADGERQRSRRWSARSSAGFSDRGAGGL